MDWVGDIPEHWEIHRLKHVASVQFSSVDKHTLEGEEPVRLCNYVDVYYNDFITADIEFMSASATQSEVARFQLCRGDVLVTKDSESWDDIAVPSYVAEKLEGVLCGYHLAHIRPHPRKLLGEYLFRAFRSRGINDQFRIAANGITRFGLGKYWLDNGLFPIPSLDEQRSIAAFLDRETARIDMLIEKKQRQIELLQEKRSALISHAVTKGLDPDAKMKDSGIEWLGQIPAHWGTRRLRYLGYCQNGINIGAEKFGTGYPFVSYGDVYNNSALPVVGSGLVESSDADRTRYSVETGDVFFTRTSETIEEIGFSSVCFKTIPDAVFAGFLIRFRPVGKTLNIGFSEFHFRSDHLRAFFVKEMNLVTRASLSQDLLKDMPVLLPPIEEQAQIASILNQKMTQITSLIQKIQDSIVKLQEHRTALISAAVTGKIDVRKEASA
jgi:type I restriction enzyme S subunit